LLGVLAVFILAGFASFQFAPFNFNAREESYLVKLDLEIRFIYKMFCLLFAGLIGSIKFESLLAKIMTKFLFEMIILLG